MNGGTIAAGEQTTKEKFDERDTKEKRRNGYVECLPVHFDVTERLETKVFTDRGVWKAAGHASEIDAPVGKFLYVGNRGHDSACFVGVEDELVRVWHEVPSGGKCQEISTLARTVVLFCVGNQNSSNMASFAVCPESGLGWYA